MGEEFQGRQGQPAGLKEASLVEQEQSLVNVDEGRPDLILFMHEHGPRFGKKLQSVEGLALLTGGNRQIGFGFRRLVGSAQFLETSERLLSHLFRVCAEVQLQVDFREIQVAKRLVMEVT